MKDEIAMSRLIDTHNNAVLVDFDVDLKREVLNSGLRLNVRQKRLSRRLFIKDWERNARVGLENIISLGENDRLDLGKGREGLLVEDLTPPGLFDFEFGNERARHRSPSDWIKGVGSSGATVFHNGSR